MDNLEERLQELREYVCGPYPLAFLFGMIAGRRHWTYLECGTSQAMYAQIPKCLTSANYAHFHIAGAHNRGKSKEDIASHPRGAMLGRLEDPRPFLVVGQSFPEQIFGVWGIFDESNKWQLLHKGVPSVEEWPHLSNLHRYDRVRLCGYTAKLACIESIEMVIPKIGGTIP